MGRLVLWGLNRVARWDPEPLVEALSASRGFAGPAHQVRAGDRGRFNSERATEGEPAHALQHEGELDEYFVPIAVKVIGDPLRFERRFRPLMSESGRAAFQRLLAAYPFYFADRRWRQYWVDGADDGSGMCTPRGVGYCEIVREELRADEKAVLVGYSQGGLTAHFLAWLDETLFADAHRKVAGIITVQSPNRGSPLASFRNADNVARGLFEAVAGALNYPALPDRLLKGAPSWRLDDAFDSLTRARRPRPGTFDQPSHFDIESIAELLDAAIDDAHSKKGPEHLELLQTARKWMTGLVNDPGRAPLAFEDLNTTELDRPNSILWLLRDGLRHTMHGAVVGTDNKLEDMVRDGLSPLLRWVARATGFPEFLTERLERAERAFSQVALDLRLATAKDEDLGDAERALARDYAEGVEVRGPYEVPLMIPAYAHDFIIPAASQALRPHDDARRYFLGNLINPHATHLGGAREGELFQPRESDRKLVQTLLRSMALRLAE